MNRRTRLFVGGALLGATVTGTLVVLLSNSDDLPRGDQIGASTGAALGGGIAAVTTRVDSFSAPYDCARWPAAAAPKPELVGTLGGRRFERSGAHVTAIGGDQTLTVAFVADARGSKENLAGLRAEFERRGVELVVALGGMGQDRAELLAVHRALARGAPWPLLALPGGSESIPEHRVAMAELANDSDILMFDGAQTRLFQIDGVTLATLPGVTQAKQLAAGRNGCAHSSTALAALSGHLEEQDHQVILATYVPPRQQGSAGSDLATGGIHIGESELAALVAAAEPMAVVHGVLDEAAGDRLAGFWRRGDSPLYLAAGSAEGLPQYLPGQKTLLGASAVVLRVTRNRIRWWRIELPPK